MNATDSLVALGKIEKSKIKDKNNVYNYLPIRGKNNDIKYDTVAGILLGTLIGKVLDKDAYKPEEFQTACLSKLCEKLSDEAIKTHIENIYFQGNVLMKVTPEFMLLSRYEKESKASGYLSQIFCNFLSEKNQFCEIDSKANFIERIFLDVMEAYLKPYSREESSVEPYLPFIAEQFSIDIQFLSGKSEYLLHHFEEFLELYNFIYCSQLALNIKKEKFSVPESRELYFILDTEKASQERTHIQKDGCQHLLSAFNDVFPTLSMLENINGASADKDCKVIPLWRYAQALESTGETHHGVSEALQVYANNFQENRKIKSRGAGELSSKNQLNRLFLYALDQFNTNRYVGKASRHEISGAYVRQFIDKIAGKFITNRGRSGRVLVLNQDFLLLLTNISIGNNKQLRFQELLQEFRKRGVYFDKQSEQALVAFYERVGNVDRMSDSGDAIYVRSTI